jgi:DNA modification methylase/DNA-directed RNA polymerase subunit RPC12/RpoP
MQYPMNPAINYYQGHERSRGHTAIYKIHKYFARRPHNQFRTLIEHYVPEDGLVLDCFAGGGVTLIEGLSVGRRVISVDVNPIAALVQRGQVNEVPATRVEELTRSIVEGIPESHVRWYTSACHSCGEPAHVRWFEHAYTVRCPLCSQGTMLSAEHKALNARGVARNGFYACSSCSKTFAAVDAPRTGSVVLKVRIRCASCGEHATKEADAQDQALYDAVSSNEVDICADYDLDVPAAEFPLGWDRQIEDAMARKGFVRFSDLFTPRNRIVMAHLFAGLDRLRESISDDEYIGVLVLLSALLRYANNMTFSTGSWMDGRPVAWAKHAYWTPNQFVEVNPFEYLQHRQLALRKAEKDRATRFVAKRRSDDPGTVVASDADYSIICADSRRLDLPEQSVDAVITDPPFGSNVQYGELTHLWSVWLEGRNPYSPPLFDLDDEILVHRKRRTDGKDFHDYEAGLADVFRECHRVLIPEGVLVFTFNNRSAEAWYAAMKSALDAGFAIESDGIHYLEEIRAYRDTAHLRYDGELQGDVLYTFVKGSVGVSPGAKGIPIVEWVQQFVGGMSEKTTADDEAAQAVDLHLGVVRQAALSLQRRESEEDTLRWLELLRVVARKPADGPESIRSRCLAWAEQQDIR